jgi:HAD superfamily hydrolase (TIGR01509 family)
MLATTARAAVAYVVGGQRGRCRRRSIENRGDDVDEVSAVDEIAAVLWDMDGTLVDSEKLWTVALYEAVEWLGGTLTTDQRAALVGSNMTATCRELLRVTGKPVDDEAVAEVAQWIRTRVKTLFADEIPWREGANEALLAVREAGVPSALVTSTERDITELALRTIGHDKFDVTVCGDEVDGLNKPNPEPYLRAARLLGVDPARCVAVEDSPVGAESAVAAGCTVLVVPHEVPVPPGRRRVFRSSLVGVDVPTLTALARSV